MKKLFTFLLICICALLCACGKVVPVETTKAEDITKTMSEATTVITTEEVIAALEPHRAEVYPICNLDWIRTIASNDEYAYEAPALEIEFYLPSNWQDEHGKFVSPNGDTLQLGTHSFFISEKCGLTELPFPQILLNVLEPIETFEAENMLVYVCNNINIREHKYYILGYVRHSQYAFPFVVHSNSVDCSVFDIINQSISVKSSLDEQPYANNDSSYATLKKVHINDLTCVYDKSLMGRVVDDLPKELHIELDLPENWTFIPAVKSENNSSSSHTIYSEFGLPKCGLSPDKCYYQAFCGYNTYIAETAEFYDIEGITASGNKYWIEKKELSDYHAIDCSVLVQLSDEYYYHFSLCVDKGDAELIEKVVDSIRLVTEPSTVEKLGTVLNSLWWVRNYYYKNGSPVVKLSISTPDGWETTGTDFRSSSDDSLLSFSYELYETGGAIPLSELSGSRIQYVELIDTVDEPNLFAEIYLHSSPELFNYGYKYLTTGYISLDDRYAISFWLHSDSNDISKIEPFLNAVTVTESPETPSIDTADVKIGEETKSVKIGNLFCVNHRTMYESDGEYLPENSYIELDLPASWELLGKDSIMTNAIYSELGVPGTSLSPKKCLYQGFASDTLYTKDVASLGETEGVTDSGNKYWFTKQTYDYYHAVEYDIDVQVSEEYIYSFTLCVDKDNTDLLEQVIDSVALVYEPSDILE